MVKTSIIKFSSEFDLGSRLAYAFLFGLLGYICAVMAGTADLAARESILRAWSLLVAAVVAVSVPHVLLPDPHWNLIQLLNKRPGALLEHQVKRWISVVFLLAMPCLILAFYDIHHLREDLFTKTTYFFEGLLLTLGICAYGFGRYVTIGQISQAWQEGQKGNLFRKLNALTTTPIVLPDGLIPPLLTTGRIFFIGILSVAACGYMSALFTEDLAWLPGFVLIGWSTVQLLRRVSVYDRHFYCTNAFYTEIFRSAGGVRMSERDPIPYKSLYWVPPVLRAHVWAGLLQLDRKFPLGRLIFLGHLGLWTLFYQDAALNIIAAYLLLLIVAKNAVIYLLVTRPFAPTSIFYTSHPVTIRIMTRLFINLRWTFPLLLSLLMVVLLKRSFLVDQALFWTALDILAALFTAWIFTYVTELQNKRRFA